MTFEDAIMQEEIFGPLLPVITYRTLDEAIARINSMECPLSLYLFSKKKENIEKVTAKCQFGGGCVNDTIIHLATPYMGFGGCGESGMGSYHGKDGFETFSHTKSIVAKKTMDRSSGAVSALSSGQKVAFEKSAWIVDTPHS